LFTLGHNKVTIVIGADGPYKLTILIREASILVFWQAVPLAPSPVDISRRPGLELGEANRQAAQDPTSPVPFWVELRGRKTFSVPY
jgi:hypothetical protein